jgi:hypothetical protein
MSSGEAELYALTKGAANTLGAISLAGDFGAALDGRVSCDSAAAIGIVNRTGAGKLRHVKVQYLWMQQKVRDGELEVKKVPGVDNPADLLTKHLDEATMKKHLVSLGFELRKDRAASAPTLHLCREGAEEATSEDEPRNDEWISDGVVAVRHHRRERRSLFTPLRVSGAPPAKALTPMRLTEGTMADGSLFRHVDTWTARATAHASLSQPWRGKTTFYVRSVGGAETKT